MGRHCCDLSVQVIPTKIPVQEYKTLIAEIAELFYLQFEQRELTGPDSRSNPRNTLAPRDGFLKERARNEKRI